MFLHTHTHTPPGEFCHPLEKVCGRQCSETHLHIITVTRCRPPPYYNLFPAYLNNVTSFMSLPYPRRVFLLIENNYMIVN